DEAVSRVLFALPHVILRGLDVVWLVGALPVTVAALAWATFGRSLSRSRRLWAWLGFALIGLVELAAKHYVGTPMPPGSVVSVPWIDRLSASLNAAESVWLPWLGGVVAAVTGHHEGGAAFGLAGSFPSGHVARITYVSAFVLARADRRLLTAIGFAAGLAVVATGGHWLWDAVGGFVLAWIALQAAARVR
ncbi:MAG TPA: phosphatase PAP2 family protein, partial [Limnochordia bacterium]|nr:phosphatase PAP2 family protein [Limnochordia bacterium]